MSSTRWIRTNGQAELHENVRSAIKARGLSQSEAAHRAGIKYQHLLGLLSSNCWFTREAASALAEMLEVSLTGLIGNSIFNDERSRYAEHDRTPDDVERWRVEYDAKNAAQQSERRAAAQAGQARALCCVCGALRTTKAKRYRWEPSSAEGASRGRMTTRLRCVECREQTTHAILLTTTKRDDAELLDRAPTRQAAAAAELRALIDRLAGFNVHVHFDRGRVGKRGGDLFPCSFEFDESKSRWRIEIDPAAPERIQVALLGHAWERISENDFGKFDAEQGRRGPLSAPSDDDWSDATAEVMEDVTRFLIIERRKLVQSVNDELEQGDT